VVQFLLRQIQDECKHFPDYYLGFFSLTLT
jgi:hypothetical protein